eukprot:13761276-Alexandrium_andersonii.AAC.1
MGRLGQQRAHSILAAQCAYWLWCGHWARVPFPRNRAARVATVHAWSAGLDSSLSLFSAFSASRPTTLPAGLLAPLT